MTDIPDYDLLAVSNLFDSAFYLRSNPDIASAGADPVEHYLKWGAFENRRPHPFFDGAWYLRMNTDVAAAAINPLVHFLRHGRSEGRKGNKSFAIYTAIIGDFDELRPPVIQDEDSDYFVFTDMADPLIPAPWIRLLVTNHFRNDRVTSRYYKTQPHRLFMHYEYSVWVDAVYESEIYRVLL